MICAQRTAYPLPRHGRKKLTLPLSKIFYFFRNFVRDTKTK